MKGITDTAVRQMMEYNRIEPHSIDRTNPKRPLIDSDLADADLERNTDPNRDRRTKSGKGSTTSLVAKDQKVKSKYKEKKEASFKQIRAVADRARLNDDGEAEFDDEEPEIDINADPTDIYTARTQEAIWKAIKIKLETQKLRRILVEIEEVNQQLADFGVMLRQNIMDVPDRLAPILANTTDKVKVRDILYKELESVLLKNSKKEAK